jgi:hypothetical protein
MSIPKAERLRRLLIGDLRRVFRHRWGPMLPDDGAGRDDLNLLLIPISLDAKRPVEKMTAEIVVIAPWMPPIEAKQIIGDLVNLPVFYRKPSAKEIGERLRLTNTERERLKAWQIAPVDRTKEELVEQRKAKKRARAKRARRKAGTVARADYLAKSRSRLEPWKAECVCRRTWERRQAKATVASPCQTKVLIGGHTLATPTPSVTPDGLQGGTLDKGHDQPERQRQTEPKPSCSGHGLATSSTEDEPVSRGTGIARQALAKADDRILAKRE